MDGCVLNKARKSEDCSSGSRKKTTPENLPPLTLNLNLTLTFSGWGRAFWKFFLETVLGGFYFDKFTKIHVKHMRRLVFT